MTRSTRALWRNSVRWTWCHSHLDAGCDVVLVCHPELVDESLKAVEGRRLNTMALTGLIGGGAMGWDNLLADTRYLDRRDRLGGVA